MGFALSVSLQNDNQTPEDRLIDRKKGMSSTIPLTRWTEYIMKTRENANCVASAFESDYIMIDTEVNEYSEVLGVYPIFDCDLSTIETTEEALVLI